MTQDEIIEMLRASCDKDRVDPEQNGFWVIVTDELERFAKLVAQHERERIKVANAPEIERVNAHIKELENAILAEREACAKLFDDRNTGTGFYEPHEPAEIIRARGQA